MEDSLTPQMKDLLVNFIAEGNIQHTNSGDVVFKSQVESIGLTFKQANKIFLELEDMKCLRISTQKPAQIFYNLTGLFDTFYLNGGYTHLMVYSKQEVELLHKELLLIEELLGQDKDKFPKFMDFMSNGCTILEFLGNCMTKLLSN